MTREGIKVGESKIEAIRMWPTLKSIDDVGSFYGLAFFYRRFIKAFSTIMALMIEGTKDKSFKWLPKAHTAFEEGKDKLNKAPVLALPCFDKVFEVKCDAFRIGIAGVLVQEGQPLAFFGENLCESAGMGVGRVRGRYSYTCIHTHFQKSSPFPYPYPYPSGFQNPSPYPYP